MSTFSTPAGRAIAAVDVTDFHGSFINVRDKPTQELLEWLQDALAERTDYAGELPDDDTVHEVVDSVMPIYTVDRLHLLAANLNVIGMGSDLADNGGVATVDVLAGFDIYVALQKSARALLKAAASNLDSMSELGDENE